MKIRNKLPSGKIEMQMSAMIDIVFQLLIFFMLTLKIIPEEGEFEINMPVGAQNSASTEPNIDFTVRLISDSAGNLREIRIGDTSLGNDEAAFLRLNNQVKSHAKSGGKFNDDMEVTLDVDYELNYKYIIKAVANCTGYREGDKTVKFLEKIKFSAPREPKAG
ncbi:MAG: biopolymer transporter ExbD [Planctomycetaceae bacterium]